MAFLCGCELPARHAVKNICVGDKTLHPQAQIFFLYLLYKASDIGI